MEKWIAERIEQILGFDDEIVINLAIAELERDSEKGVCPKKMQINLTGFLEKNSPVFMLELWKLLLEAQNSPGGIVGSPHDDPYFKSRNS